MTADIRFYWALFLRRLPLFLFVFISVSAGGAFLALTLPPVFQSKMRIVVESAQISDNLVQSTVRTPAREQLQLFESRLLARDNLLEIAQNLSPLPDQNTMSPDEIVAAMAAATRIRSSSGRDAATTMFISFESVNPRKAAAVLNAYLTFLLDQDVEYRTGRANQTQEFFENEVDRLSAALDEQSARILKFQTDNADAQPGDLAFFRSQQSTFQERLVQIDRDVAALEKQKVSLRQVFEATGNIVKDDSPRPLTPEENRLQQLKTQLADLEAIYAPQSSRVRVMRNRIAQLEASIQDQPLTTEASADGTTDTAPDPARTVFDLQIADVDAQIVQLATDRDYYTAELNEIETALRKMPGNIITLEALERDYVNVQNQYNRAVDRLSAASTGERIESLSRGQRVSVIEQPAVPDSPIKPSRKKIAAAGMLGGALGGLVLIVLLELLSSNIKRPADLINELGITPLATIPYMPTKGETMRRRLRKVMLSLVVCIGVPASLWFIHTSYMPLDVILQKVASRIGISI